MKPWPRPFSATSLSSDIQKPQGDFVGRPLAGAFSERAQVRCLRRFQVFRLSVFRSQPPVLRLRFLRPLRLLAGNPPSSLDVNV